MKNGII